MDMSNYRPEIHIAHQTRRDKLRIHNHVVSNPPNHHLGLYSINNNMNFSYDPSEFCSTTDSFDYPPDAVNINRDPQSYFITPTTTATTTTTDNRWVSTNRTPNFVGNIGSDNPVMSTLDVKSYDQGYEEFHPPSSNNQNHRPGEISSPFYHNALQELVSTSGVRSFAPTGSSNRKGSEGTSNGPWMVNSGELLLLPSYGDQSGLRCSDDSIHRPVTAHHWKDELDHFASSGKDNSHTQTLSLSLSSVQSPNIQDFIIPNLPSGGKISENARQEMMGTQALSTHRNPGPLGPFTGYATILRSSNFLTPAQMLLDELCGVSGPNNKGIGTVLEEVGVFGEGVISNGEQHGMIAGDSGRWMDRYRPEKFQKKAKLLYMQDEVCKRYEHYHQQMQMVVSSFESVAGLSAATPYVSFALKMVAKNFRCLKNAITDQLRSIRNGLSEELCNGNDASGSMMLKVFDQSLQKSKGVSDNVLEGQHIWRPQRGLPERAVSVLRAWLFDHFLHPYPTDTDKHMLAIQTGLTRNQVSNWFINARVRVWKPMVEEIHVLETKAMSNDTCSDGRTTTTIADRDRRANKSTNKMPDDNYSRRVDPPEQASDRSTSACRINQEKRSRIEYRHVPMSVIDGSLTGFVPSHQTVSLTLGLRQSAENGQRSHYTGRVIRDSVG